MIAVGGDDDNAAGFGDAGDFPDEGFGVICVLNDAGGNDGVEGIRREGPDVVETDGLQNGPFTKAFAGAGDTLGRNFDASEVSEPQFQCAGQPGTFSAADVENRGGFGEFGNISKAFAVADGRMKSPSRAWAASSRPGGWADPFG